MKEFICSLELLRRKIALDVVRLSHLSGTPHLACNLSPLSVLVALFWGVMNIDPSRPRWGERDKFFMSKGHASPSHYLILAHKGYFPLEDVFTLGQDDSFFEEHAGVDAPPGIEAVTGSLGHALGIASGMALANKIVGKRNHHFVVMGDGELNEGSVWEAALFAPAKKLNNVTAIVDYNKWQATGRSNDITSMAPLLDKFSAFGWDACEVDGHDISMLIDVFLSCKNSSKPTAVICNTVKGHGVSFMEDDNNWHYRVPNAEEVAVAAGELGDA